MTEVLSWIGGLGLVLTAIVLYFKKPNEQATQFEKHVEEASRLETEIKKLKEESIRDTANFEDALKKYRAKYGTRQRPVDTEPGSGK